MGSRVVSKRLRNEMNTGVPPTPWCTSPIMSVFSLARGEYRTDNLECKCQSVGNGFPHFHFYLGSDEAKDA